MQIGVPWGQRPPTAHRTHCSLLTVRFLGGLVLAYLAYNRNLISDSEFPVWFVRSPAHVIIVLTLGMPTNSACGAVSPYANHVTSRPESARTPLVGQGHLSCPCPRLEVSPQACDSNVPSHYLLPSRHAPTPMYSRLTLSTAPPLYNRCYYDLAPL